MQNTSDTVQNDIYDPVFVANMFDRCSANYRWWSAISSFGFFSFGVVNALAFSPHQYDRVQ